MKEVTRFWPGWEVVRKIGVGSFGSVYEIQRNTFGNMESAALKVITIPQNSSDIEELYNDGYDDESIAARFQSYLEDIVREYSMMASMKGHTNVVYCDDLKYVQHDDGFGWDIYIKMELLTPLTHKLGKVITEAEVISLGIDICSALILCKDRNIVHRDIKPQNIFVSRDGNCKLGDFGIAKTAERTTSGTKVGTYKYMAPEVYMSQPYGSRADIYSLGLVMYWMLNERRTPFLPVPPQAPTAGMEEDARRRRFAGETIPAPLHGSAQLQRIVLKACAFDQKDRYVSAAEMREELLKLTRGSTVFETRKETAERTAEKCAVAVAPADPMPAEDRESAEGTVNLFSGIRTEHQEDAPTEYIRDEKTEYIPEEKTEYIPRQQEPEKKKKRLPLILGAAAAVLIVLLLLFLRSCDADQPESTQNEQNRTESTRTEMVSAQWSEWLDALPEHITEAGYEIESVTLYSSALLEKTESTTQSEMEGWELYHTAQGGTDYSAWSDWTTEKPAEAEGQEIQAETRYCFREKLFATGTSSVKEGWTLYDTSDSADGSYGAWSDWSETEVTASDTRKVESKKQYSYRHWSDGYTYGEWSAWGDWQDGLPVVIQPSTGVSMPETTRYETRTVWPYYYYICPSCGAHVPEAACGPKTGGCIDDFPASDFVYVLIYDPLAWEDATVYTVIGYEYAEELSGDDYCEYYYIDKTLESKDQYRVSTRTAEAVRTYTEWSAYSDNQPLVTMYMETRTRTLYRYCDLQETAVYHFWRWGNWSGWTAEETAASEDREVKSAVYYRSRSIVSETTYYFQRWTDWTEYTEEEVTPSDSVQVRTKTQYRYRKKTE